MFCPERNLQPAADMSSAEKTGDETGSVFLLITVQLLDVIGKPNRLHVRFMSNNNVVKKKGA